MDGLAEEELRDLVTDLIPALGETRMVLAHTKLQLNLLTIEAEEAAHRAEVEHDMTKREVEVLQASSPILRNRPPSFNDAASPIFQIQQQLEISLQNAQELEAENSQLSHRLKQAKRVIKHLDGKNSQLTEDNQLLRERIRQNRDHLNALRESGTQIFSQSPRPAFQTPPPRIKASQSGSSRATGQNPLDALLMADQILREDPTSVPSTPTPYRATRQNQGHTRGTQSLSSLPSTPNRSRPLTAEEVLRTPVNQVIHSSQLAHSAPAPHVRNIAFSRNNEDRESTISASEDEARTDEDVPASQASQAASSMLRRNPGVESGQSTPVSTSNQERLVQTNLRGKIVKPRASDRGQKHKYDNDSAPEDEARSRKRPRTDSGRGERFGLGIGVWTSLRR